MLTSTVRTELLIKFVIIMASRFGNTSATVQKERILNVNSEKTLKSNKFASKILKEYLFEKGESPDFETYSVADLDKTLGRFYMDLRRTDGTSYKINSVEGIRHGINRYLKNPPFNKRFDIIKDSEFVGSNLNFKAVQVELKRTGNGDVTHYAVIPEADLQNLYSSMHMNTDAPQGLFSKVQFDVRLYFCRRGNENMHTMTKRTFKVERDSQSGLKYVKKNRGPTHENPIKSLRQALCQKREVQIRAMNCHLKSLSKLHPGCNRLWQKPKDSFMSDDVTWYCNVPVREKKLKMFLSTLSTASGLSKIYTNHSIRATGTTLLSKNMFGPAKIMAVTGHTSVQSLTVYQRVDEMGQTLSENLEPTETNQITLYSGSVSFMRSSIPLQKLRL